mmetsp:Transcript_547/g.827  ORF Transcript_547/g.827 Transcript_547/m.827 type:complete len:219 (-) Transcript_547:61-717(-)
MHPPAAICLLVNNDIMFDKSALFVIKHSFWLTHNIPCNDQSWQKEVWATVIASPMSILRKEHRIKMRTLLGSFRWGLWPSVSFRRFVSCSEIVPNLLCTENSICAIGVNRWIKSLVTSSASCHFLNYSFMNIVVLLFRRFACGSNVIAIRPDLTPCRFSGQCNVSCEFLFFLESIFGNIMCIFGHNTTPIWIKIFNDDILIKPFWLTLDFMFSWSTRI